MPFLQGLLGGSPYDAQIDPRARQGLMGDASRMLGIGLLSQSQNANFGEGLAKALQAARETYGQGAESLYNIGRQQELDEIAKQRADAYNEYLSAQATSAQAKADAAEKKSLEEAQQAQLSKAEYDKWKKSLSEEDQADLTALEHLTAIGAPAGVKESFLGGGKSEEASPWLAIQQGWLNLKRQEMEGGGGGGPSAKDVAGLGWKIFLEGNKGDSTISPEDALESARKFFAGASAGGGGGGESEPPPMDSASTKAALENMIQSGATTRDRVEAARSQGYTDEQILSALREAAGANP